VEDVLERCVERDDTVVVVPVVEADDEDRVEDDDTGIGIVIVIPVIGGKLVVELSPAVADQIDVGLALLPVLVVEVPLIDRILMLLLTCVDEVTDGTVVLRRVAGVSEDAGEISDVEMGSVVDGGNGRSSYEGGEIPEGDWEA
jgi:hypothetical protein